MTTLLVKLYNILPATIKEVSEWVCNAVVFAADKLTL